MRIPSEKKIIFVDDEPLIRELAINSFSSEFKIFTAENFKEIKQIICNNPDIGVVISDYIMPGEDGISILKKMKQGYPNIRRILFSANLNLEATIKSVNEADVHAIIQKPWHREEFIDQINDQFDQYFKKLIQKNEISTMKGKLDKLKIPQQQDMLLDMMFTLSESTKLEDFTSQFIKVIDGMKSMCSLNTLIFFETGKKEYYPGILDILSDIEVFSNQYDQKILLMYVELLRAYFDTYSDNYDDAMDHYKHCLSIMQWLSSEVLEQQFVDFIKEFPLFEDFRTYDSVEEVRNLIGIEKIKAGIHGLLQYDVGNLVSISETLYASFPQEQGALDYIIIVKDDLPVYERSENNKEYNVGLISGFVVALSLFLQEVVLGSGDLDAIKHENGVILFYNINNVKYVLLTSADDAFYRIGLRNFAISTEPIIQKIPESHYPNKEKRAEIDRFWKEIFRID